MEKDDLFALFDMKPTEVSSPKLAATKQPVNDDDEEHTVSSTVLELDKWDLARGEDLHRKLHQNSLSKEAVADFYAAAFQPEPVITEYPADKRRAEFVTNLMSTPEYQELHLTTKLDQGASELAAEQFAKQYAALLQQDKQQQARQKHGKQGKSQKEQEKAQQRAEMACLFAASAAAQASQEELDEMDDMASGIGHGAGDPNGKIDRALVARAFKRVRNNAMLRAILNRAGQFRRYAQAAQRRKNVHGYDDVVGVELSGDVSRLTTYELAVLGHPLLKLDALRRLSERQSMSRKYQGIERLGKGPVVVCVDGSESMTSHNKFVDAKAFAATMAWVARHQRRWCHLVEFASSTDDNFLTLPVSKWNETAFLDWLEHFFRGGTDADVPLVNVPKRWAEIGAPKGKTDMILLTDGIISVDDNMAAQFNAWKKQEKVCLIALLVGYGGYDAGLSKVADETHDMSKIDTDSEAVQKCFSI